MNTKISIIIPIYNVELYLKQCLDSVVNQTLKDIEIICINSASVDNSSKILNEYSAQDNRIVVAELKENLGQGIARNKALEMAKGEYVMFLDADDWLELNACEIAYEEITKQKCDFVKFAYKTFNEQTKEIANQYSAVEILLKNKNFDIRNSNIDFMRACYSWTQIYNRNFLISNNIKYANLRLCEDVQFIINAWVKAKNFAALNIPLYNYRTNRAKNTTNNTLHWKDVLEARKNAFNIIQNSKYSNLLFTTYFPYCIRTIVNYYHRMSKIDKNIKRFFYDEMKKFFGNINKLSKNKLINTNYGQFKVYLRVLKYNYFVYNLIDKLKRNI